MNRLSLRGSVTVMVTFMFRVRERERLKFMIDVRVRFTARFKSSVRQH